MPFSSLLLCQSRLLLCISHKHENQKNKENKADTTEYMSLSSETMLVFKRSMLTLYYDTDMIDNIQIQIFYPNLCISIAMLFYYWWSSEGLLILMF